MEFRPHRSLPPPGLVNLGSTCFINSCLQVLHQISAFDVVQASFREHLRSQEYPEDAQLMVEWLQLRHHALHFDAPVPGAIHPMNMLRAVHAAARKHQRSLFASWGQQDMPEFLLFLVECLHRSIARPVRVEFHVPEGASEEDVMVRCCRRMQRLYEKEYSEFYPLFYGMSVSSVLSPTTGQLLSDPVVDEYFVLNLPIPAGTGGAANRLSLTDCLRFFTAPEPVSDWKNSQGVETPALKQIQFLSFPRILVVAFKRFANNQQKNGVMIDFPHELDLSEFVVSNRRGESAATHADVEEGYRYRLQGVVNHMGTVSGGHYTAFARKPHSDDWFLFNDETVTAVAPNLVITEHAYCLFYRKQ
jgi:ubiquitin carboxyl-terminal hydrolase 8